MRYNAREYIDHLGNKFPSEKALLEYYNIAKTTFHRKLREGLPLEEILTKWQRQSTKCYDHLGNEFSSITQMIKHYGVTEHNYLCGIHHNFSLEKILTKKRQTISDHLGQQFKTKKDMCKHWNISINSVKRRLRNGWDMEKTLIEPLHRPCSFPRIIYTDKVKQIIQVQKHIDNDYFLCSINGSEIIMARDDIIMHAQNIIKNNK